MGGTKQAQGDSKEMWWMRATKCDPRQRLTLFLLVFYQIIFGQVKRLIQAVRAKSENWVIR